MCHLRARAYLQGIVAFDMIVALEVHEHEGRFTLTHDEATTLAAAVRVLRSIESRFDPDQGWDTGRVTGAAKVAGDAVFSVLNIATHHTHDKAAAEALANVLGRGAYTDE